MNLAQNKAVHGIGGFLLMGAWAAFANRTHEMPAPLVAGAVQGALTAVITLFLKQIIESVFHYADGGRRFILPPIIAFLISAVLLTVIHTLAKTPALLATISVPLAVSTLYAFLYTITLSRHV